MAMTKCKECGKEVSDSAESCPECGYSFKKDREGKEKAIGCLVTIALIVIVGFWLSSGDGGSGSGSETTDWRQKDNSTMAYIMTQDFVKDRLASPSTADFPSMAWSDDVNVFKNGQTYTVNAYVDSQNRLGATLRTYFVAKIE